LDTSLTFFVWYDPSPLPLAQKITEATARYKDKYGRTANYVLISEKQTEILVKGLEGELGVVVERSQYLGLDTIYLTERLQVSGLATETASLGTNRRNNKAKSTLV